MRVLFPFVGDTVGGSHISSSVLISKLSHCSVEATVIVHRAGKLERFFCDQEIFFHKNYQLPVWNPRCSTVVNLFYIIANIFNLVGVVRNHRIDMVHINDARMLLTWFLPCIFAKVPYIVHQRTVYHHSKIYDIALRMSSRIICISNFVKESLPQNLQHKCNVIYNSPGDVCSVTVGCSLREELKFDRDVFLISFVGTLNFQKRPLVALETLNILKSIYPSVHLVVVGRAGDYSFAEIERFAKDLGLLDHITLLGQRDDATSIMSESDLVLIPAVNEGGGRVLLESFLVGTPFVAAASGGHVELTQLLGTGILVSPDAPELFADSAATLARRNESTKNRSKICAKDVPSIFSIEQHARDILAVYRSISAPVAIVIESLQGGGAQKVVSELVQFWCQRGDQVCLITMKAPSTDQYKTPVQMRRYYMGDLPNSSVFAVRIFFNILRIFHIRRILKQSRAKTVVAFVGTTNTLAAIASVGLKVKVVLSERNDIKLQPVALPWKYLRRLVYPRANVITANTERSVDFLKRLVGSEKVSLVRNPVQIRRTAEKPTTHNKYILVVGRLHPQKNTGDIIRAFARANLPSYRLRILGDGPEKPLLLNLARQCGVASRVDFLGHVDNPYSHYESAQIFVMFSLYEGSPNALWEAMSCGLACIVSDSVYGAFEIAEHGIHVCRVKSKSVIELSAAMELLVDDEIEREQLGRNAQLLMQDYSEKVGFADWDRVVFGF